MKDTITVSGHDKESWRIQVTTSTGLDLLLRQLTEHDVSEEYLSWLLDPGVNRFLESRFTEQDMESIGRFVTDCARNPGDLLMGIFTLDRVHIGNIKIGNIDFNHWNADIGVLVGNHTYWGRGVATAAIASTSRLADEGLKLNKTVAGAYASNVASIRAFKKNGYVQAGKWSRHVRLDEGSYDDVILLERHY